MRLRESLSLLRPFVGAELYKLRRSRSAKAMVVAIAVASPLVTGITWLLLSDEKLSTFPRVLELIYLPLWLLAGLMGLLLTVEVMANEFELGTARTVMGRGTPRWLFVGGKAIALLVAVVANVAVGTVSGGLFATISHLNQMGTSGLAEGWRAFFLSCLPAAGVTILSGLAYIGIVSLFAVLLRSAALAMLIGLLVFGGDFIIEMFEMEGLDLGLYSIFYNTYVLLSQILGDMSILGNLSEGSLNPSRALLVLALYSIVGTSLAHFAFKQQDLAGEK